MMKEKKKKKRKKKKEDWEGVEMIFIQIMRSSYVMKAGNFQSFRARKSQLQQKQKNFWEIRKVGKSSELFT